MSLDMTRRGFLRWLGIGAAAGVAASVLPPIDWSSTEPLIVPPSMPIIAQPLSLRWMTMEMARQLGDRLDRPMEHMENLHLFGSGAGHLSVDMRACGVTDLLAPSDFRDRWITPMSVAMSAKMREHRFTKMGRLELPMAVAEAVRMDDATTGISVRGLRHGYLDVETGEWIDMFRFDVLGQP